VSDGDPKPDGPLISLGTGSAAQTLGGKMSLLAVIAYQHTGGK
jgi:hypothetical protein